MMAVLRWYLKEAIEGMEEAHRITEGTTVGSAFDEAREYLQRRTRRLLLRAYGTRAQLSESALHVGAQSTIS
jgi:hypothetical protein